MSETREDRIMLAGKSIRELERYREGIRSEEIRQGIAELKRSLETLRDTQYLFDSGEKELIRLYERYIPYLMDIIGQYQTMESAGNYEALQKSRTQLLKTLAQMNEVVVSVTKILPQDEIDEANARAKAEELRRMLDEQRRSVVK